MHVRNQKNKKGVILTQTPLSAKKNKEKGERQTAGVYANSKIAKSVYLHTDKLKIRG